MITMPEGMYESERCKFCHDFGLKVRPRVCEIYFDLALELAASEGWAKRDTGTFSDAADVRAIRKEEISNGI